ncbi:MAG: hypothetical protein JKP92_09115 [Alphaproteobacteria bacterium]|jgi:hypothetical protein|nr:hypothetical protein [Alphaproteobacteria bacterium]
MTQSHPTGEATKGEAVTDAEHYRMALRMLEGLEGILGMDPGIADPLDRAKAIFATHMLCARMVRWTLDRDRNAFDRALAAIQGAEQAA